MKPKNLNSLVANYKRQLAAGEIQVAYAELVKFVMSLKTRFSRSLIDQFTCGSIFQGYMDYTYFYLVSEPYQVRNLKLGLVLNHQRMRFDLWLLGRTKSVQKAYWTKLRPTEWVRSEEMPRYSVFEHLLISDPDFDDLDSLRETLERKVVRASDEILKTILRLEGGGS